MDDQWVTHELKAGDVDREVLIDREWLLTNGTGAYAMGTVAGVNTRRYHGLLVAATRPPVGRVMALNQMFERLTFAPARKRPLEWTTCTFRDPEGGRSFAPAGIEMLDSFHKGLSVAWSHRHEDIDFTRELFLHWKQQAVTLRYTIRGLMQDATLSLHPMLTMRDFHGLLHQSETDDFEVEPAAGRITIRRGGTAVTLGCDTAQFNGTADWWYDIYYPVESARGQEDHEDYFMPGRFEVALEPGRDQHVVTVTAALGDQPADPCPDTNARIEHLAPILAHAPAPTPGRRKSRARGRQAERRRAGSIERDDRIKKILAMAADDFVVDRRLGGEKLSTILAGYPWFADWGRDTFIALPGLLLATGRVEAASETLRVFAGAIRDGLVPNRFDDYDESTAHYNTVDASLWFIRATLEYVSQSGDRDAWDNCLGSAVGKVLEAYINGTRFGIKMAGDGLIAAGSDRTQLTWMDAARDGTVFTPRFGKAVEINALWYHALLGTAELIAPKDAATADHYIRLAGRIRRAFTKTLWDEQAGHLRDHVRIDDEGNEQGDLSFRPNQIFALCLPHSPLPRTKQKRALAAIRERLLTPFGLRTLPLDDPMYHGHYRGSPYDRDKAYHQGTVWPWLIGPYAEAVLRVGRFGPKSLRDARAAIDPLLTFLAERGLGQLHEIHDADPPHHPAGCIAQAWSVAEVLRVLQLIKSAENH